MKRNDTGQEQKPLQSLYTSLLLVLVALVSITAATTAWLTLGDHTRVYSMVMDVNSGTNIRFDLDPHREILDYVRTLNFGTISARIAREKGFDPRETPLMPVTTTDYSRFFDQYDKTVSVNSGDYLEFTLHFMSNCDCIVHLTSANSEGYSDGTRIHSDVPTLPEAMRISFTDGGTTVVYDPGLGDRQELVYGAKNFGLPNAKDMVYSDINALFTLKKNVDKPILVRIWMEGTDEKCTDELQKANYSVALRFEGTDENNAVFEQNPHVR